MKTNPTPILVHAAFVATLFGVVPGIAAPDMKDENQDRTRATSSMDRGTSQRQLRPASEDPRGRRAGELLGMEVRGTGDEKLGDVHDFVVDASSGEVSYVVVSTGGVLGFGDEMRAVPVAACTMHADHVALDLSRTRWEQAPVFNRAQLIALNTKGRTDHIHAFFDSPTGGRASGESDDKAMKKSSREQPREFVLASEIRGKEVHSANEQIGEIDDVIIQPGSYRVAALLDADDVFAGNDRDYLVPLGKLNGFNTDRLTTTLGRQDFSRAGEFTEASWSAPVSHVSTIYFWPIYPTTGEQRDRTTMNDSASASRDRADGTDSTGAGRAPLTAIREAVQSATSNAGNADVRVVTEKEKVVLLGTVPSEEMKDRIEERAAKAASGWEIDNRLRVAQNR